MARIKLTQSRRYLNEVESLLESFMARESKARWLAEDYIGGGQSKLMYLNLKIPMVRAAYKRGFSFSQLPLQGIFWDYGYRDVPLANQ